MWIRVLLYADDGALVAESAADLQLMLDVLLTYCSKWRMLVNISKTEIMIFNRKHPIDKYRFSFNKNNLGINKEFKYLGVMFHESRQKGYASCIANRLVKAKKLKATWIRRCEIWLFKPDVILNQFMTCILPCLEYGVSLWGVGRRRGDCGAWNDIELFWRQAAKHILGMPIRAPDSAVSGELGWFPFWVRAGWQAASFWTRITEMSDACLAKKAMYVQRSLVVQGHNCWLGSFKNTLHKTGMGRVIWDKWWNNLDFMANKCGCVRYEVHESKVTNQVRISSVRWEDDVYEAFKEEAINTWRFDINRKEAKYNGVGGNKLRTYSKFKKCWGFEKYLGVIVNSSKRRLMSKFRMGICPLRIESGRYEGGTRLPPEKRVCRCCHLNEVEDEEHFFNVCPAFKENRKKLMDVFEKCDKQLANNSTSNLLCQSMESSDPAIIQAVADYIFDSFEKRELFVCDKI